MKHTSQSIVLALLVMVAATGSAYAVIADSVADFSDTQGLNSWYYGEWAAAPAGASVDEYDAASFTQLPYYWPDTVWGFPAWVRGPEGTNWWPFVGPEQTQPSPFNSAWAIRRWMSTFTGTVTITGVVQRVEGVGGDGIRLSIMKNASTPTTDDTLSSVVYAGDDVSPRGYSIGAFPITAGDTIDFIADRISSVEYDRTKFTAQIWDAAAAPSNLSGHVELESFNGSRYLTPVLIELVPNPDGVARTERVYLDAGNNYLVSGVLPGTYNVYFSATGFLRKLAPTSPVTISLGAPTTCNVSLTNGDIDGDNEITTTDLSVALTNIDKVGD